LTLELAPRDAVLIFKRATVNIRRRDLEAAEHDYQVLQERLPNSQVAPVLRDLLDRAQKRRSGG
jgi:hypothetical protein